MYQSSGRLPRKAFVYDLRLEGLDDGVHSTHAPCLDTTNLDI
jgi:hypothetical protein